MITGGVPDLYQPGCNCVGRWLSGCHWALHLWCCVPTPSGQVVWLSGHLGQLRAVFLSPLAHSSPSPALEWEDNKWLNYGSVFLSNGSYGADWGMQEGL